MTQPSYQNISSDRIPEISLTDNGKVVRVIAGEFAELKGLAQTSTLIQVWDLRFKSERQINLELFINAFDANYLP